MGIDASFFAKNSKKWIDIDRFRNLDFNPHPDLLEVDKKEFYHLVGILKEGNLVTRPQIEYLIQNNNWRSFAEEKEVEDPCPRCGRFLEKGEKCSRDFPEPYNKILQFVEKYPDDSFFVAHDHEEPADGDYIKEYASFFKEEEDPIESKLRGDYKAYTLDSEIDPGMKQILDE